MRLLHTSDWHLGQTLHQFDRSDEHRRFLEWLLETLESEAIDCLLIAGDVFDNSNPSAAAQALLYRFLTEARRRVAQLDIVLIAGNHDSPGRLEATAPFLALFDARVVGQVARSVTGIDVESLVLPLKNRQGEVAAWCIAVPFLRPGDVPRIDGASDPYVAGIEAVYQQALVVAQGRRRPGQAIVALGHCHMTGSQTSDESERRIVIGGAEALSSRVFDASIAYVALGHLHLAQKVGGDPTRRYCGSPLPMSFAEIDYPHQVLVVDLDGEAVSAIRDIRVPRSVELLRVPASPGELAAVVAELAALDLAPRDEAQWPYLQVRVRLTQPEPTLRAQIDAAIDGKPLRLARIETSYRRADNDADADADMASTLSVDALNALAPGVFFERLYQHRFGDAAPRELVAAFNELLQASGEASASS